VGSVNLVPVASPDHPLARLSRAGVGDCRNHVQLVLTDRSTRFAGDESGVMGTHTWRVADLATKHMLLKEGIGWGTLPEPLAQEDILLGRLVRLNLADYKGGHYGFFAIHRTDTPPGPAVSFLLSQFQSQALKMSDDTVASRIGAVGLPPIEIHLPAQSW
jgi:DNA-binding transcriptional LysR family regulator